MENIVKGPKLRSNFPDENLGKIFFDKLKEKSLNDDVILVDESIGRSLTYKELFENSVKLSKALKQLGIKNGDIIGLVSGNRVEYSILMISCCYIGAVINSINPQYTFRELKHAFDITKPKFVFIEEEMLETLAKLNDQCGYMKEIILLGSEKCGSNIKYFEDLLKVSNFDVEKFRLDDLGESPKDLVAAVLCSSGTTGLPKGVMLTHQNFRIALTYFMSEYGSLDKGAVAVFVLPFFHIFGFLVNMACILYEAKLVFLRKFHPQSYLSAMEKHRITNLMVVPSLAQFLAKSELVDNYDLTSIRQIASSAAPLGGEIESILNKKFKVNVRQIYAMTESCTSITMMPQNVLDKPGSSGKILHGMEIKIADVDTGKALGPNQRGEICCRTLANMKGYFGNKKATEDIFDEDGFLHSGDIGYYDDDGYFYIVDRLKELIKYKGFQVSPSELEDILISHPDIKDAGVIGIPDEKSGEVPLAFVVRKPGTHIQESEIHKFLADIVSVQKQLRGGIRFIDDIPKGGTGKILRRKLREFVKN